MTIPVGSANQRRQGIPAISQGSHLPQRQRPEIRPRWWLERLSGKVSIRLSYYDICRTRASPPFSLNPNLSGENDGIVRRGYIKQSRYANKGHFYKTKLRVLQLSTSTIRSLNPLWQPTIQTWQGQFRPALAMDLLIIVNWVRVDLVKS